MKNIGYHFTGQNLRDGRPIPPIGETLVHEGDIRICESGLHGSDRAWHALKYAPGQMLHRVSYSDPEKRHDDKWVTRERTILASIDATDLLRRFACDQALSVSHMWDPPESVLDYLEEPTEEKRAAAQVASQGAYWDAADAAWDAARGAARNASWVSAWAAARAAAWASAWTAARDAAWVSAWAAARDAAWDAAWTAARDAAWDAAGDEFGRRVHAAFQEAAA